MSEALTEYYEPLRVVLGDSDADSKRWTDDNLLAGLRLVLRGGLLPGHSLGDDKVSVDPAVSDPNKYLLFLYHAARQFARPAARRTSFRTRALSGSDGGAKELLWALDNDIHELENGSLLTTWQEFLPYVASVSYSNIWARLVEVKTEAPVNTVTIGHDVTVE